MGHILMSHSAYTGIAACLCPNAQVERIVRLTGGVSADVHRLDLKLIDGTTSSVVLRAHRAFHSGHSVELEYQLLQALHQNGLSVPKPLLVDSGSSILGNPFLVIEFIEGTSEIPSTHKGQYIDLVADKLAEIHTLSIADLPTLPMRTDLLPEVLDYLPEDLEWKSLIDHLRSRSDTKYLELPKLLHGDFWPENLLWQNGSIASILDWEDAAFGDPLSDVAGCRLELRYKFGREGMQRFTQAYAKHRVVDRDRLALWQVYVAAAAQQFMGEWGLDPALEAHMRAEALSSIREAGDILTRSI